MKSATLLLEELNSLDEHASIEAKTGSQLGESLMETICAFANEPHLGGGHLILGVAYATDSFWPSYEVVGVRNVDQLQSDIASQCASMFNVAIRPQISVESIHGKNVVVVFVPEAGAHEKPVHFKGKPLPQSARRRIGSTDQRCTDDDMVAFYDERRGQSYDEQIVPDARLDDFDDEAVELYRQLRREVDPRAEELSWEQNDLLEAVSAVKRHKNELKPTIAGVLLFGKPIALRRLFPMMRIDYIRVAGTQWVKDPDRRFDTIEIRSPLIRAIQRARSAVLDDLPKAFSLPAGEIQGQEIPLLPDRAVREVIANAVMHRDYRVHGSIQIIRYANRLEVRNPGFSIKAEERLGEPGSETRNPKIAALLHDLKLAETKGSGIRVMRELMAERDLSPPLFQSDRTGNSFLAMLLFHHFLGQEDLDWLKSFEQHSLTEDEMKAMISAREVGAIDNSTYRDINRDSDTLSASKHLRKLCDFGLLEKKGQGPATYYVPTPKSLDNWPPARHAADTPPALHNSSEVIDAKSTKLDPQSTKLDPESTKLDTKSTKLGAKSTKLSPEESFPTPPPELQALIDSLGGRGSKESAHEAVVRLLSWRALSVRQLATLLTRTPSHVRQEYIRPLIAAGRIEPTNPDSPTDPTQMYRTTQRPSDPDT